MTIEGNVQPIAKVNQFNFTHLKEFAQYIYDFKLEEAAALNIKLSKSLNLPLLKLFSHLSEEELMAMSLQSQKEFFQQVLDNTTFEKARESLNSWKQNKLEGISREKIQIADIVFSYSIRKQLCIELLPGFTTDCHKLVAIVQELEKLHLELERMAYHKYVEIQQDELFQQNQFLSSLINNSADGILAIDTAMNVIEWNPSLEKSLGINKERIMGKGILDFFPALANAPIFKAFREALSGKTTHIPYNPYTSIKGVYEANVSPLRNASGQVIGALAMAHDITHRIEIEEKLKEHQEELEATNEELREQREQINAVNEELQENMSRLEEARETLELTVQQLEEAQAIAKLGSFEYHIKNNNVIWSNELKRIFGFQEENFKLDYEGYLNQLHEDDRVIIEAKVANAIKEGEPFSLEHRIIRPGGEIRWLLSNAVPVYSSLGEITKIQGTAMDITERKLANLKLEEEQYFIQKITDTSPDVITIFDLDQRENIYGNRELSSILGYDDEEIQMLRKDPDFIQKLIHPDDLEVAFSFLHAFKTYTGTQAKEVEYRIRTKSGKYIWVGARYNVFRKNAQGLPSQIIGVTRNINGRKLAEEAIQQANYRLHETNEELIRTEELLKEANNELEEQVMRRTAELQRKNVQLERINADLDNFIYTASHDLKVPIVNLEGLLILLNKKLMDVLPEQEHKLLAMMQTSIERFKVTIQDLTDVTKMQKDLDEESREVIHLPEVVEDIKKDIYQLIQQNNAKIETDFEVKEIPFDRKNIRSIVYNLLTNAIKYRSADRNPEIKIQTKKAGKGICLIVSDNGEGIPENSYQKVFSLFKRLHKKVEGSGMGLYIVKRIVENNSGTIKVESEIGKGSTFKVFLPNEK